MDEHVSRVGAVVLAAGMSRRMGTPKLVLPWGATTVIGHVVETLAECGVSDIVVVTGASHDLLVDVLKDSRARLAFNPDYNNGEMIVSLQVGIRALSHGTGAFLLALGDQPQIEAGTVRSVIDAYRATPAKLVVPSYQMRRGHPWLVDQSLWPVLLAEPASTTLRDFLNQHQAGIHYVTVDTPSVLFDLDTPEDYRRHTQGG